MIEKPKRKSPSQSRLARWRDRILFRKWFIFETPLSAELCIERLMAGAKAPSGCNPMVGLCVDIDTKEPERAYEFTLKAIQAGRLGQITLGQAKGIIEARDTTSLIYGHVRFAEFQYLTTLLGIAVIHYWFSSQQAQLNKIPTFSSYHSDLLIAMMCGAGLLLIGFALFWMLVFSTRRHLLFYIEQAVLPRKEKRADLSN